MIANLTVWFALHVFFARVELIEKGFFQILIPDLASVEWGVLPIIVVCGFLLFWRQWESWKIIAVAAALGIGLSIF